MIGNDVVDLAQRGTQPGAQHPRFDARVFSERERELIAGDATQRVRWVLWAAKEAAYKVAKKLDRSVVWAPARFEVSLESREAGSVRHGEREFALRVEVRDAYVHALARGGSSACGSIACGERSGVAEAASADLSGAARDFARDSLAARLGCSAERLSIAKRGRIPVLCIDGEPARADLSLSHHGRFVAFACELETFAFAARLAS
jgi:phosphopantetheinyl transferase (holo-ACP synthase)